jgi:hypothetical protein
MPSGIRGVRESEPRLIVTQVRRGPFAKRPERATCAVLAALARLGLISIRRIPGTE